MAGPFQPPLETAALASEMLTWAHRYLGSSHAAADALLGQIPSGSPASFVNEMETSRKSFGANESGFQDMFRTATGNLLKEATATVMAGRFPRGMHEIVLGQFYDPFRLPRNLRIYTLNVMGSVNLYGKRDEALAEFPRLYEATALPILKERLESFGVTPQDIQQILRDHPGIEPMYAVWFLAGVVPPYERVEKANQISGEALRFASAILGENPAVLKYDPEPDPIDNRPLRALLDLDGLPSRDVLLRQIITPNSPPTVRHYLNYTHALPVTLNKQFDNDRLRAIGEALDTQHKRRNAKHTYRMIVSGSTSMVVETAYGMPAGGKIPFGVLLPDNFFDRVEINEKRREYLDQISWDNIRPSIRGKFEAAHYDSGEKIAAALNALPGQAEITRHPRIVLRYNHGHLFYIMTGPEVLYALANPQHARFNGGCVRLIHDQLCHLADPAADLDEFYELEKPELQTAEHRIVADFWQRITEGAIRTNPLAQYAVTDNQRMALINMWIPDVTDFLENLHMAYAGDDPKKPATILAYMEEAIGVSLSFEDCLAIRKERHEAETEARQEARAAAAAARAEGYARAEADRREKLRRRKESQGQTAPAAAPKAPEPVNPWADIPKSVVELCARKGFASFDAVVASADALIASRIREANTNGRPRAVGRHVRLTLQNLGSGFLPNNRPVTVMHNYMRDVLNLTPGEVKALPQEQKGKVKWDQAAAEVQANIVEAVMAAPRLAHIVSWAQLTEEHKGADVLQLTRNLDGAYRLLRPGELSITPNPTLSNILSALNKGSAQQLVTPDEIVSRETWLSTYRSRHVNSAIPPDIKAADLLIG